MNVRPGDAYDGETLPFVTRLSGYTPFASPRNPQIPPYLDDIARCWLLINKEHPTLSDLRVIAVLLGSYDKGKPEVPAESERAGGAQLARPSYPTVPGLAQLRKTIDQVPSGHETLETAISLAKTLVRNKWNTELNYAASQVMPVSGSFDLAYGAVVANDIGYGYASFLYSRPEQSLYHGDKTWTTGAVIDYSGIDSADATASNRIGGSFLIGRQNSFVATTDAGYYTFPSGVDISETLSVRVAQGKANPQPLKLKKLAAAAKLAADAQDEAAYEFSKNQLETVVWDKNAFRRIDDHMRPGDVWVNASPRWITSSYPKYTGEAYTGSVSLALSGVRSRDLIWTNPSVATTLSLSGTYSAQHNLQLNEYAVELRTPIMGTGVHETPLYAVGRYGTRGDVWLGLEYRF